MKKRVVLRAKQPIKGTIFSETSDKELALIVRRNFPSLTGPLEDLLQRFERSGRRIEVGTIEEATGHCPRCGTELEVVK